MADFNTLEKLINEKFKRVHDRFDDNFNQHNDIIKRQDIANGNVKKNTEFRNKVLGGMIVVGLVGIGSIVSSVVALFKISSL